MSLTTSDYANYDLSSWSLQVVMESKQSVSAKREAKINFTLDLRDICWDLPYTDFSVITTPLSFKIWQQHQFSHNNMVMVAPWNDYCTGSSYSLEYVSGPMLKSGQDPLTVNINQYYVDKNKYNTAGFSADPYFIGTIPDLVWEGTHTVRIVAQEGVAPPAGKLYRKLYSANFQITFLNPCKTAIVTPRVINNMMNTVGVLTYVYQTYEDFKDDVSTT